MAALAAVTVAVAALVGLERWLRFRRWQIEREVMSSGDRARLAVVESAVKGMTPEELEKLKQRMVSLELKAGVRR